MTPPSRRNVPRRKRGSGPRLIAALLWFGVGCGALAVVLAVLLASSSRGARGLERLQKALFEPLIETRVETREVEVEVPEAPAAPTPAQAEYDLRRLFNGIELATGADFCGGRSAAVERVVDDSYRARVVVEARRPRAAITLDEILAQNSQLADILPGLPELLATATVSPYFDRLYDEKESRIRANLHQLNRLVSRHNFFDCETILQLRSPETGRKALFILADMDVVSDGSDGDRLPKMPPEITESTHYQPTTSYGWRKKGDIENPLLPGLRRRLQEARDEFAIPGLSVDHNRRLRATIARLEPLVEELQYRSFLIAEYDPFVVLPVYMITDRSGDPFAPRVGDYAVVIYEDRILPAIVGDAGPNYKVGEASLRIGREIDPRTNPYRRPVSDLTAAYVVFPGTRFRPHDEPDLDLWFDECMRLLGEIGGLGEGHELHRWVDLLKQMAADRKAGEEGTADEGSQNGSENSNGDNDREIEGEQENGDDSGNQEASAAT